MIIANVDGGARIVQHMNAWTRTGCIEFVQTNGVGDVRISFGSGGYWSYLGTDIRLIPQNRQTMLVPDCTTVTATWVVRAGMPLAVPVIVAV